MIFRFATPSCAHHTMRRERCPRIRVMGPNGPMTRVALSVHQAKCFFQTDRGEDYGNCEKTSGKKSRSCESTGQKSDCCASAGYNGGSPSAASQKGSRKGCPCKGTRKSG